MSQTHRARVIIGGILLALGLIGCSSSPQIEPSEIDSYERSNVSFFRPITYSGSALEPEHYKSLKDATQSASAVVIAQITDVRPGSITVGEVPSDVVRRIAFDIHPIEVIKGNLDEGFRDSLTMERLSGDDVGASVDYMRSRLGEGLSVWFLRNMDDYSRRMRGKPLSEEEKKVTVYRPISSQAVFVQGKDSVVSPLYGHDGGMADEGQSYQKMSALVDYIRSVDGWTGKAPR